MEKTVERCWEARVEFIEFKRVEKIDGEVDGVAVKVKSLGEFSQKFTVYRKYYDSGYEYLEKGDGLRMTIIKYREDDKFYFSNCYVYPGGFKGE